MIIVTFCRAMVVHWTGRDRLGVRIFFRIHFAAQLFGSNVFNLACSRNFTWCTYENRADMILGRMFV